MNITNKNFFQVWIGLAKVKPFSKSVLENFTGAYVNVLALSKNKEDFRRKISLELQKMGLLLMRLEGAQPFAERIAHCDVDISLRKMANDILINTDSIHFDTFHAYD